MTKKTADEIQTELDQRFAVFGLRPLADSDVWTLGMAAMVMPDGNPGAEAYLAQVSGALLFAHRLTMWGRVLAIGISQAAYKAPDGARRRSYVEGYDESWGRYAVADGLTLALYGCAEEGVSERARALKCGKQGYQRIRDFVGGATVSAVSEFRHALAWAAGYQRDRVFEGRWEGVTGAKWDDSREHERMERAGRIYSPLFAPGCGRASLLDSDTRQDPRHEQLPKVDSETLYHGLRPTDWWDEAYARRMRLECPAVTIYPATD